MNDWHVLTVSRGGTVSLIKNLTKLEAKQLVFRLTPHYVDGRIYFQHDGDLVRVEAFGPNGESINEWQDVNL